MISDGYMSPRLSPDSSRQAVTFSRVGFERARNAANVLTPWANTKPKAPRTCARTIHGYQFIGR